jgi:PAS domain S-box-containing protein
MNEQISAGLLTFSDVDTTLLQVLKNDSLAAFTSINRIVLFINRDLILEGNINRFHNNYERAIRDLEIQQKNISIYVLSLKEKQYHDLSRQLTQTYKEITSLVPEFEKLNLENQKISQNLQSHKIEISAITQQITEQSELLRQQKNKNIKILQLMGQGSILIFLLVGGSLFAFSITTPLRKLTRGTKEISSGDYSKKLDIVKKDEIGQLARDFNKMRENLRKSFYLIDEQREQYQSIFENAIEGIFQTTTDGKILKSNQAFAELLGYQSSEELESIITNTALQLYQLPGDGKRFMESLEKEGHIREFETRLKQKDGKIITVLLNAQAIVDEKGETRFYQGMIEDISERRRIEEYKIARDAAEESNRAKSEFLANMSHELRTPLNAILGFSQLMSHNENLNVDEKNNLQIINRSGEHLLTLINDILDMSKIEAGRVSLNESDFNLHRLLDDVHDMFRINAAENGLEILFIRDTEVPQYVRSDETKIRQVLVNLISNAVKFTDKGSVKVRVSLVEELLLRFNITDTGSGISPNDLDRLFDPFTQTQAGKNVNEGTGLGLAISQKFVKLMGGEINIDSQMGRGSVFSFNIKINSGDKSQIEKEQPIRRVIGLEPDNDGSVHQKHRILIVDDMITNRQVLVTLIAPLDLEVREASSGQEALGIWKEWKPHLIWLDMRMPGMGGYEVVKQIRASSQTDSPFIISISASVFDEDRQKALDAGCDGFVKKPYKEFEIFEEMKKYLGLQYIYDQTTQAASTETSNSEQDSNTLKRMINIRADWKTEMKQAIEHVDLDRLHILIEKIREQDHTLADVIQKLIDNFEYDQISSHIV